VYYSVFNYSSFILVTKKTWVTAETKTEKGEVEVVEEKKEAKKEEKPLAAAPAKKKQAGIMSFFIKK